MTYHRTIIFGQGEDAYPVDLQVENSDRDLGTMISFEYGGKWYNITAHCEQGWFTKGELIHIEWIIKQKLDEGDF